MRRCQRTVPFVFGMAAAFYTMDVAAGPPTRLAIDLYASESVVARNRTYQFLSVTDSGGPSASRIAVKYWTPVAALAVNSTYRVWPSIGFGLECVAAFELRQAAHPWSQRIGFSFERGRYVAVSSVVQVDPRMRDFSPRHGWTFQGGLGMHWLHDGLVQHPLLLQVRRATSGYQMAGALGYRWHVAGSTSVALLLRMELLTTGVQAGLFLGGGLR